MEGLYFFHQKCYTKVKGLDSRGGPLYETLSGTPTPRFLAPSSFQTRPFCKIRLNSHCFTVCVKGWAIIFLMMTYTVTVKPEYHDGHPRE